MDAEFLLIFTVAILRNLRPFFLQENTISELQKTEVGILVDFWATRDPWVATG